MKDREGTRIQIEQLAHMPVAALLVSFWRDLRGR